MSTAAGVLSPVREDHFVSMGYARRGKSWDESILIYLTLAGSVIPMRVLESDSIASVKLKIQTFKGFLKNKQMLVHRGRELARNDSLIKDYGVSDGNVLHLIIRLSDLQSITVKTVCGKELEFQVERHRNIGYVKQQIARKGKGLVDLKDQGLVCNGEELDDLSLVDDICTDGEAMIHLIVRKNVKLSGSPVEKDYELSIVASTVSEKPVDEQRTTEEWSYKSEFEAITRKTPDSDYWLEPVIVNPVAGLGSVLRDLIDSVVDGMASGYSPIRSSEGSGGAYFLRDFSGNKYAAVFKPIDEEPKAVNNPRGLPVSLDGEGLKRGTRVGEGAHREVAAYILDHPKGGRRLFFDNAVGFAGVPPTVMARCLHSGFNHPEGYDRSAKNVKFGSLQMFQKNYGSCEDMGPGAFPVQEVHKISVLDIRLANADRHAGNILVCKAGDEGRTVLIPIDHGYCIPENFEDCTFDWLYWPQAREPYNAETVDYIMSMDAEKDIALLKFHGWELSLECSRTLRISTMLLKKGAQRGMSPYEIGSIMCRETLNKESVIEEIMHEAQEGILPGMSETAFLDDVSQILDRRLDDLVAKKGI
ncbi:phosphatidylinositol 4-kinase gamma 4-like [Nymphaea colorata]|nr:phosphatidylinositol 4-kinase gamma 4-like [Nymphaea colorata]